MSNETQRFKDNRSFILQTVLPREYNTRPCPLQHPVAVTKNVTIDQKTLIKAQNFPSSNSTRVRMDRGLYLWNVKDGVESLYHMAIVDAGAVAYRVPVAGFTPQLNVNSAANNNSPFARYYPTGLIAFTFRKALAIPRLDDAPTFSPNLAEKFSRTRVYGGDLRLISNTIASGSTVLNGLLSAAVISDTRDIAQNDGGNDCFSVVDMAQAARTPKEIVRDVSAASGVISLVGADIDATYRAPDSLNDVRTSDGWFTQPAMQAINAVDMNIPDGGLTPTATQNSIYTSWASPWGVQQTEGWEGLASGNNYAGYQGIIDASGNSAIQLPPLAESGIMDVVFDIQCVFNNIAGGNSPGYSIKLVSVVEHYFAGVNDSVAGTVSFAMLSTMNTKIATWRDLVDYNSGTASSQLLTNNGIAFGHHSDISDQYIAAGGMKKLGKFIGIKTYATMSIVTSQPLTLSITSTFTSSTVPIVGNATLGPMGSWQTTTASNSLAGPRVSYRAREINLEGQCGPVHILRYDDIGAEQNLVLNGMLNTESVATSGIAPYVRESIANSKMAADANVYPVVYTLYNCLSRFKETWDLQDYLASRDYFRNLTPEEFAAIGEEDPRVETSMQAAGLFGSLGNLLGGAAGGLIGNSGLGSALGGALGGIGDSMMGSSGQYGGMRSAGQFGDMRSAGQFGEMNARGQFGAKGNFADTAQQDFGSANGNCFTDKTSCRRQRQY